MSLQWGLSIMFFALSHNVTDFRWEMQELSLLSLHDFAQSFIGNWIKIKSHLSSAWAAVSSVLNI